MRRALHEGHTPRPLQEKAIRKSCPHCGQRRLAFERALRAEKAKALAAVGADERSRFLTAAYRAAPIDDRPRNIIAMLKDVPPADIEAMLLRHAKADGEALCDLGQRRAQAVKRTGWSAPAASPPSGCSSSRGRGAPRRRMAAASGALILR